MAASRQAPSRQAASRTADLGECAACVCFAVRRAARVITQHYDHLLRPSGLRATQFTLLTMLSLGGPMPLRRVADRLGMERTTLTRNLEPLLAAGLVRVEQGDDRRVRTLAITDEGQRAVRGALPAWRKAQRTVTRQLTSGVVASLSDAVQRLAHEPSGRADARKARASRA